MPTYNRKDDLSSAFNDFWRKALNSNEDYYSKVTLKEFVHLKKAITNINNIITMLVTESFVKTLHKDGVISTPQQSKMLEQLYETHANTNGFDVEYNAGQMKIVAEVKCNIPVNETSFGAAQENSIMEDVDHLFHSKKRSNLTSEDIQDFYKFMVFLDVENVRVSTQKLIRKLTKKGLNVTEYTPKTKLQKDIVYFIYISTDKQS
jgi:hypothetical protein